MVTIVGVMELESFRVYGLGFRVCVVWGSGFRVALGVRVLILGHKRGTPILGNTQFHET